LFAIRIFLCFATIVGIFMRRSFTLENRIKISIFGLYL